MDTTIQRKQRKLLAFLVCGAVACSVLSGTLLAFIHTEAPTKASQRTLTFAERVAYQRAIEDVYWRHRIWPMENFGPGSHRETRPTFSTIDRDPKPKPVR